MRILVTGSNGLLGSRTAALLARQGHEVVSTGRGARRCEGDFRYAPCDLAKPEELQALFDEARPERVIHSGALKQVDLCESAPMDAFQVNVSATALLAERAKATGAHLLYVSTDYVFDGEAGPYAEGAIPNPTGVYAVTKHMGEQAVRTLAGSWAIARTAVVYGWPAAGRSNFGAWLVRALSAGEPVPLFTDQHITPSLATNVAGMIAEISTAAHEGLWHCAGAQVVTRVEFGERLCALFGFDRSLLRPRTIAEVALKGPRPKRCGLNVDKAASTLAHRPLELDEALRIFRDECRAG